MASVRLRKGSKFWYACIRLPDGRQRHWSTGLEDRSEALAVATAAERALKKDADRPHRLRAALARLADDYTPSDEVSPADWLRRWCEARKVEVSPGTTTAYRRVLDEAGEWMTKEGLDSFSKLTTAKIGEFRAWMADRFAPSTVNKKIKFLRVALSAAVRDGRMDSNPAESVGRMKTGEAVRRQFRPDELARLLRHLKTDPEWHALTVMGLFTGQRLNDVAVLVWEQIDLKAGTVTMTARKTGRLVSLPLVKPALESLRRLRGRKLADSGPVFPTIAKLAASSRSNAFRRKLEAAGIDVGSEERDDGKRRRSALSYHSLRHTTTTMLKAAGVSDAVARAIVGHESAAVSRVYTHLDLDTMRAALESISLRESGASPSTPATARSPS